MTSCRGHYKLIDGLKMFHMGEIFRSETMLLSALSGARITGTSLTVSPTRGVMTRALRHAAFTLRSLGRDMGLGEQLELPTPSSRKITQCPRHPLLHTSQLVAHLLNGELILLPAEDDELPCRTCTAWDTDHPLCLCLW